MRNYKLIRFKVNYKNKDEDIIIKEDNDIIMEDLVNEKKPLTKEEKIKKYIINIEFMYNTYYYPCNSTIYISRYSCFDSKKLERVYKLDRNAYDKEHKTDNYYEYFLLLYMMVKNNDIKSLNKNKDLISKFNFTDYIKLLKNKDKDKKKVLTFNYNEMIVYIREQMNNFSLSKNIKYSLNYFEDLLLYQLDFRPLYKITNYNDYYKERHKTLKEIIQDKNKLNMVNYETFNLESPKKINDGEEIYIYEIKRTLMYYINKYLYLNNINIIDKEFEEFLKRIKSMFKNGNYDFFIHGNLVNSKGTITKISMMKVYSFYIKNNTILYNEDTYIKNYLKFYKLYNFPKWRFVFASRVDEVIHNTNFYDIEVSNFLYKHKGEITYNTHCIIQIINQNDILLSKCRYFIYDTKYENRFNYMDYNKKCFNLAKFDDDKIYINQFTKFAKFKDIFQSIGIKRNLKYVNFIRFRTDNFILISPTSKQVSHYYNNIQLEVNKGELFDLYYLDKKIFYTKRVEIWKTRGFLEIQGFQIYIDNRITLLQNPYLKLFYETLNSNYFNNLIISDNLKFPMYFYGQNKSIYNKIKIFSDLNIYNDMNINNNLKKYIDLINPQINYNTNSLIISFIQLNKQTNKKILYDLLFKLDLYTLYDIEFYYYLYYKNLKYNVYTFDTNFNYEYVSYKRILKDKFDINISINEMQKCGNFIYNYYYKNLILNISILNLCLFYGVKFPLEENNEIIPLDPYDLFNYQNKINNFINENHINENMIKQLYSLYKKIYLEIFEEKKKKLIFLAMYYKNSIVDKNQIIPNINEYYSSNLYKDKIYFLLYNYIPENIESFLIFVYKKFTDKIKDVELMKRLLFRSSIDEINYLYGEYRKYYMIQQYLIYNYNAYMKQKYGNLLTMFRIETFNNNKEIIININNSKRIYNKPPSPDSALMLYIKDNMIVKNKNAKDDDLFKQLDLICQNYNKNEDIKKKYEEKEKLNFDRFKISLFQWENEGYYIIKE